MQLSTDNILGTADNFLEILEQTSALAKLSKPVLVTGERGTGKELIASRLHYLSPRWQESFVSLNCSALNENLLDSELFGHEAGAFTGAQKRHLGRFERADRGTLFLDELATAPMIVQEKLLRVIEYGQLERVGGSQSLKVDVRLICATNANLPQLANKGLFRADLLDRLAFDVIHIPPLRERLADIMLLAEHFAINMCRELNLSFFPGFTVKAQKNLSAYPWPGNVRELKNVIERSVYRHGDRSEPLDLIVFNPFANESMMSVVTKENDELPQLPIDLKQWQQVAEKNLLEQALQISQFNQRLAASQLKLTYHQLRGLLKKHNLPENQNNK
ncbi:phage shock protein operon transcriptional activator [Arsenophonus sp.]|uniref:phage shock protein operon transcriptional activator n=1 Tax=Arsenophonus sp. TaxID=1872640 RepID=UPI00285D7116|nr:phage shock protein operon transcriptional activator [Arsenophonus sp.]MDR5618048.1 phage shock protein operon transcriptional activator [Arsenophonus sp.]